VDFLGCQNVQILNSTRLGNTKQFAAISLLWERSGYILVHFHCTVIGAVGVLKSGDFMYNLETMGAKTQFTKLFMAWFHHRQFLWTKLKEGERFYPLFWKQLHAPALSSITSLFKENRSISMVDWKKLQSQPGNFHCYIYMHKSRLFWSVSH
jgi:hypothetical protein